jgi:hypothetical protein
MSKRRKTNPKKMKGKGRTTAPKHYTSISMTALVMDLTAIDDEFNRFIQYCVNEHARQYSDLHYVAGRRESRHKLPLGFPGPPEGSPGHIAEVVVLTDTVGRRTSIVVMLDVEYRRLEERDGEVRSFANVGVPSDDGPTVSISEI